MNLNPTGVVTITSGLTASTTAQISAKLNGNEVDTITVSAFVEDTPIPAYNTVDCSGYLQSKNATETVIVTVTGHNYTLSATSNLDELDFTTATTPDQQANLDISAGVLDSGANTVTYTVSIESSSTTSDIAGNFALLLTPSNTNINT
ncbi:hypothetical protein FACS1894166_03300 [Bacilli bacterium]|nr:hypothetical protein FACS1894166_03300 [Bacilli bacterium]